MISLLTKLTHMLADYHLQSLLKALNHFVALWMVSSCIDPALLSFLMLSNLQTSDVIEALFPRRREVNQEWQKKGDNSLNMKPVGQLVRYSEHKQPFGCKIQEVNNVLVTSAGFW